MQNPLSGVIETIQKMAGKAAEPEQKEPGPGDVGPTTETKGGGLVTLPMTPDEVSEWWKQVQRSDDRIKAREEKWDILLKEYLPTVEPSATPESVKVQMHFRNIHTKIGQLFYRSPDLILTPKDPSALQNALQIAPTLPQIPGQPPQPPPTMEEIVSIKQQVLNEKLGRDGLKANRLMDELLFDVLAWTGIGCSKLGYRCVMKTVQRPKMVPMPQPGAILQTGVPPQMVPDPTGATEPVEVPIFEDYYWRRFSPKKLITNGDLHSTRFDEDATVMGMHFYMSPKKAFQAFGQSETNPKGATMDELSKASEDEKLYKYDEDKQGSLVPGLVHGVELWPKASVFTDETHPQAVNQLVLIEGIQDRPMVWRRSPDQEFDAEGKLTEDSLVGFPIRVLTIRDLADSPFPPSDSAFTNSEIKQLSTWRRQSIKIRDAGIGKYFFDKGAFDDAEIDLLQNGDVGVFIGVEDGRLAQGADRIFTTTAQVHAIQDDYRGQELIKQDINETLGIGPNQAGSPLSTVRTATESAEVQQASASRNDKELSRVIDFYLDGARMIDQLLMRYADTAEYTHIAGDEGARKMVAWTGKMLSGRYLYDIAPDSQLRVDTARDFTMTLNLYNLAAGDPLFNRSYVLRRLARMRGLDPSKATIDQSKLPPPQPEQVVPRISFSFSAEDLVIPEVQEILQKAKLLGVPTPQTPTEQEPGAGAVPNAPRGPVQMKRPQPAHPSARLGGAISPHAASNSGGRENAPGAGNHREDQVK